MLLIQKESFLLLMNFWRLTSDCFSCKLINLIKQSSSVWLAGLHVVVKQFGFTDKDGKRNKYGRGNSQWLCWDESRVEGMGKQSSPDPTVQCMTHHWIDSFPRFCFCYVAKKDIEIMQFSWTFSLTFLDIFSLTWQYLH